ncbi:MAG: hypothetical protein D6722_17875 [Bacteroidetes bacterium]|nr:MAG: hypothetical protein D6722_17875 [Bacteroidota bacterium]
MNWSVLQQDAPGIRRLQFEAEGSLLSFKEVIRFWQEWPEFRSWYSYQLAQAPFPAFFWEHPPLTVDRLSQPYEVILLDSPALARIQADPSPFLAFFRHEDPMPAVADFASLGKDAQLIVPAPSAPSAVYPHIATFARQALPDQQQALWQRLGDLMQQRVNHTPLWLSTSGLGVHWLHLRLDTQPKYYQHRAYRIW